MIYAILENDVCKSVRNSESEPTENFVVIDKLDVTYLGRTYKNGKWSEPIKQQEPITMEQLQANQLDMMMAINELYAMQAERGGQQ